MTKEEIVKLIANRMSKAAEQADIALAQVKQCKKEEDLPALDYWQKRYDENAFLQTQLSTLIVEISK